MTLFDIVNVKLSDSRLDKLKSAIKNETGVTLRLPLNMVCTSEINFLHNLLLRNRLASSLRKAFENHSTAKTSKTSKTQISKIIQSGEFLVNFLDR